MFVLASARAEVVVKDSSLNWTRFLAVKSVSDVLRITAGPLKPVLFDQTCPLERNSTRAFFSDGIVTALALPVVCASLCTLVPRMQSVTGSLRLIGPADAE